MNKNTKAESAPAPAGAQTPEISALSALRSAAAFLEAWAKNPESISRNLRIYAFKQQAEFMRAAEIQEKARRDSAPSLMAERNRLREALKDVFALMDEGWLVRDTSEDAKPGFAMRQLGPVRRLAEARAALVEGGK